MSVLRTLKGDIINCLGSVAQLQPSILGEVHSSQRVEMVKVVPPSHLTHVWTVEGRRVSPTPSSQEAPFRPNLQSPVQTGLSLCFQAWDT